MTTIKATCPTCGEVALTPDDIELRVDDSASDGSFYGFACPSCASEVRKPADERVVRLLVSGGVPALPVVPEPVRVRLRDRFDHPRLTHDDLLDFHQALKSDDWFHELTDLTNQ
ncbi:hypothetical protein [Euzebya tangerina]|uniref:hypothetical protein n=1 Tax=Euzebya tangerina TaxID=591198 RepID=UPI000E320A06|nr:hypothetical protein [Euzebya tangerina]